MAVQIQGNGGTVVEVDGTNHRALRIQQRPVEHHGNGGYRVSLQSGVMAAGLAANAEVWQLRWTHATKLCLIHKLVLDGAGGITAFAAGVTQFKATIARSWTADGSGGTAATLTGNNAKVRTSHATSAMGAIRIASTAILGLGTKTLDAQDVGAVVSSTGVTAGTVLAPEGDLIRTIGMAEHPIVLAQNEGLVVRATVPATGTWTFGITVGWTEADSY